MSAWRHVRVAHVAALLTVALIAAFPPWADDWDGLGFLASIHKLDLAAFAPHPPGYPVYVALLKLAAAFARCPAGAARIVGVASGVVTFFALSEVMAAAKPPSRAVPGLGTSRPASLAASELAGRSARAPAVRGLVAFGVCVTPLAFRSFAAVGSEGVALACAAVALAGLLARDEAWSLRARILAVGLGVGLGLGVRLSWAPLYLPMLLLVPAPLRLRTLTVAFVACIAWAVPLVVVTGPSQLVALYVTHLGGHLTRWGGTVVTEPARARFLIRDLFVDGFGGGTDALGLVILGMLALAVVLAVRSWLRRTERAERPRVVWRALLLVLPYLAWVVVGQNLRQQPRHVLPLVFLVACWLGWVAMAPHGARILRLVLVPLAILVVARTTLDAVARRTTPPPGLQLLAYLRAHEPLRASAVFTGPSGRFLEGTEWQSQTHAAGTLADALLALTHFDALPDHLFVTSELERRDEGPVPANEVALFCRPERVDRRTPCLHLYVMDAKAAAVR